MVRLLLTAVILAFAALPAHAICRVENGALVCDAAPLPTPGGVDLHPTFIDALKQLRDLRDQTTTAQPMQGG